jgi:general stress protein 26
MEVQIMESLQGQEGREKFVELVKGIKYAMLTTRSSEGHLRSRPMYTQDADFEGEIWFFTDGSSGKVDEINQYPDVNVAYSKPESNTFLSVTGRAEVVKDQQKIHEYWNPSLKAFFPDGPDDPDLVLLRIAVEEAEYWTGERNPVLRLANFAKALVTQNPDHLGEQGRIEVNAH